MNARIFHRICFVFSIAFLIVASAHSLSPQAARTSDDAVARALKIIDQMRKATHGGIVAEIKGVSLSWKARYQRLSGDQDTGEIICDISLPDKMFTRSAQTFSGQAQAVTYRVLNGEQSWYDVSTSGSDVVVTRSGGRPSNEDQAKRLQAIRREQAVVLMRLALPPSPDFPLTYAYVGEAKAGDGQADVIDVKGPGAFSARLFIDKITSRILMMILPDPGGIVRFTSQGGREPISKRSGELKLRFSDYRLKSGFMLPHLMTYESNGRIVVEYELASFKLNPVFAPDHFDPRKKRK